MRSNPKINKFLSVTLLASSLMLTGHQLTWAGTTPGFTLFSDIPREDELSFVLKDGNRSVLDSYDLKIPGSKFKYGVAQLQIYYPTAYQGSFDVNQIQVKVGDRQIPTQSIELKQNEQSIFINLKENLKTTGEISVLINNVKNPDRNAMYRFECQGKSSIEFPLARYVGTWILSID